MYDSYGRRINYLRVSLTDRCNLRCRYCMPEEGCDLYSMDDMLSLEELYEIIKILVDMGIDKIRWTGGEPLVRLGILDLIEKVSSLSGVKDLAITTNGVLLQEMAYDLKKAGLHRVNISLDTLDQEKFSYVTRGGNLDRVLSGIKAAKEVGLEPIKINTVAIRGFNDDEIEELIGLTRYGIDVRFIELMPIGEAAEYAESKLIRGSDILKMLPQLRPADPKDESSPAVYYKLKGYEGNVGFINAMSCKFCENCNRIRITPDGKLKTCLHSDNEIDLKTPLRRGEDIRKILKEAVLGKEKSHNLEDKKYIDRNMNEIGG